jgi:hypothetical protein
MKNTLLAITTLAITALAVGCNQEQTTSQQLDKVRVETKEAAQGMQDYETRTRLSLEERSASAHTALSRVKRSVLETGMLHIPGMTLHPLFKTPTALFPWMLCRTWKRRE